MKQRKKQIWIYEDTKRSLCLQKGLEPNLSIMDIVDEAIRNREQNKINRRHKNVFPKL